MAFVERLAILRDIRDALMHVQPRGLAAYTELQLDSWIGHTTNARTHGVGRGPNYTMGTVNLYDVRAPGFGIQLCGVPREAYPSPIYKRAAPYEVATMPLQPVYTGQLLSFYDAPPQTWLYHFYRANPHLAGHFTVGRLVALLDFLAVASPTPLPIQGDPWVEIRRADGAMWVHDDISGAPTWVYDSEDVVTVFRAYASKPAWGYVHGSTSVVPADRLGWTCIDDAWPGPPAVGQWRAHNGYWCIPFRVRSFHD